MQYGKYGMTWLDNFYHGKGALVVWTPNGVQTWQMRFPGDTQNVFTWQGGSAYIHTGDFNGDHVIDYIDEHGNIYEGIVNGEPPKSEPITYGLNPYLVSDINGDGYEDMITNTRVILGKATLKDPQILYLSLPDLDSNNTPITSYMVNSREMRILCRHYYWTNKVNFPFRSIYKEGMRLVRIWWEGNAFKSQMLDEFTVDTNDSTGVFAYGKVISQPMSKYYYIGATLISGKYDNTNVTVYDLSNDKFEKKYVSRIDRIADVKVLQHSMNSDTIPDWCIITFQTDGYSDINFYNGIVQNDIQQIGKYTICQRNVLASLPLSGNNPQNGIAVSGNDGECFRIVKIPNTTGLDNENNSNASPLFIESITPQPVSSKQVIQIRLSAPLMSNYEISLFSYTGNKLFQINIGQMVEGVKTISIPLAEYNLLKGVYWLTLTVGKQQIHSKLIIN
jgi:hypothetical protein